MPVSGTIMEISGLGQEAPKAKDEGFPWMSLLGYGALAGIAFYLGYTFGKSGTTETFFEGLGIIKPCRGEDKKKGRSRRRQKWCLWDSKRKRILGRHPTRSKALRQERAIKARKGRS